MTTQQETKRRAEACTGVQHRRAVGAPRRSWSFGPRTPLSRMGLKPLHAPIGRNLVVFVQPAFALAVAPVELRARPVGGRRAQLLLGQVELVGFQRRIVVERIP